MPWSAPASGHRRLSRFTTGRRALRVGAIATAVAAMLCTYIVVVVTRADAAETLLSQGRPTTASSTENVGTPATNATDGNAGTRWSSAYSDPQWIQVDLGSTQAITRVALNWEAAYATAYQIQTSANGTTWTNVYTTTTGAGGNQSLPVSGSGRYVRVNTTARATQYGVSLWEFQVFGGSTPPGTCGTANAALGKTYSASSTENAGTPASSAFDGNNGTRWSSAASDPQWVQVDLGSTQAVCGVTLNWEAAYATAYTIQVSTNGTTWTTIHTATGATGGVQTLAIAGSGRYVRMNGTARATQWGYSLWEFQVRTQGVPSTSNDVPTSPSNSPSSPSSSPSSSTSTPPGTSVLLSYKKPAFASTSQNDTNCNPCTPDKAFDNDPASRWATNPVGGWVDPGWIYVDLGATAQIKQVVLQWDPAYAVAYQIQTSADATNWTPIYTTTTGKGFRETLTVTGTGRYVRMFGTARSNGYGYSLWEFKVYGTGGAPVQPPAFPADPVFPANNLVWADEFNTGTNVDTSKWTIDAGTGQNGEIQYYTNLENTSIQAGSLVIEARKQTLGGRDYTSGRINTSNKFSTQYGRVEARIKVPKGNGLWPAFWMMGTDFLQGRPWPYNGEIDIMEILGKNTSEIYSTLHAPAYNGGGGYGQKIATVDLSLDYHTYSTEWDSKHMTFRVDNQIILVANKDTVETTRGPWVYDHQFYLILNLAVGGDFPGPIDATTPFPSRMYVDYVRVYK